MKKLIIISLAGLLTLQLAAQDNLSLAESSLGLSKNDLVTLLTKAKGRAPQKVENTDRVVYRVPSSDGHADLYIYKDSCLEVQLIYNSSGSYTKAATIVRALTQKVEGERTFYTRSSSGKPVYFSLDNSKLLIVAVDKHFFSGLSYKD